MSGIEPKAPGVWREETGRLNARRSGVSGAAPAGWPAYALAGVLRVARFFAGGLSNPNIAARPAGFGFT